MATGTYTLDPAFTPLNNNGLIIPGGKVFTYLAGTTTKTNTWTDVGLTTPNTNPIVLDSAGRATIFLSPGTSYKFVVSPSTDTDPPTSPIWTRDNIGPVPPFTSDVDIPGTAGENLSANDCIYNSTGAAGDAARTAGRWYKTDQSLAIRSGQASKIGFALSAATTGNDLTIRTAGRMTGLAALTTGLTYVTSTTPGAIAAAPVPTADTAHRRVGYADSTTSLIICEYFQPPIWANRSNDGVPVWGIVSTVQQTFDGLKIFAGGLEDSAYTAFLAGDYTNATSGMTNLALSLTLVSGLKYAFELVLQMANATAADGMKIDFDGGAATMTNFRCASVLARETGAIVTLANGVSTALATDINVAAMASTAQHMLRVSGSIEPSSSDTFIPRAAMNSVSTGTLTVYRGSWLKLRVMP